MVRKIIKIILINTIIFEVLAIQVQPSIKQYLHLTGVGPNSQSSGLAQLPTVGLPGRQSSNINSLSNSVVPSFSVVSLPGLLSGLPISQPTPRLPTLPTALPSLPSTDILGDSTSPIDGNVLNNLAIALQLLIVSNILNMPLTESSIEALPGLEAFEISPSYSPVSQNKPSAPFHEFLDPKVPISPYPSSNSFTSPSSTQYPSYSPISPPVSPSYAPPSPKPTYSYETSPFPSQSMPNANFVGSSGFADPSPMLSSFPRSYGSPKPNPRTSMTLMSPYEALGPNSPYSDPILSSPYGVVGTKNDFQSPYSSMLSDNDLFNMNDLF